MQPLNPFLRALFRSTLPGQAVPVHNHVLLVPTTDVLLTARDRESERPYTDLVRDEDFLGSHVLRISTGSGSGGKDSNNVRESRGKARSYTTINGRTVIIKENMVYSNKGFKNLSQAQLLSDAIYFSAYDAQNWLIYYISRPLVAAFDAMPIIPAIVPGDVSNKTSFAATPLASPTSKKKDIRSFSDLLNNFPMIARQMQPGLERLFSECGKELGKPLPLPPSRASSISQHNDDGTTDEWSSNGSIHATKSNGHAKAAWSPAEYFDGEENHMRQALETAVTAAIDLFQSVDKQQLSFLGATTDLTGPGVERLIEQYVAEQVHNTLLFPRICSLYRSENQELNRRIRHMENIDVSQVGITITSGKAGKDDLVHRLGKGVEAFRKMGVACSPQESLQTLLETEKAITNQSASHPPSSEAASEKLGSVVTVNADVLVSLLLIVVIRSQTRHLQARLSYMQRFIFIEDVESGEVGYALSTFEAVLSYLMKDSGGLRQASARNRRLWNATKAGNLLEMKAMFESEDVDENERLWEEPQETSADTELDSLGAEARDSTQDLPVAWGQVASGASRRPSACSESNLSHVFPFQSSSCATWTSSPTRKGKKVSMDLRSLSGSSIVSFRSRTTTIGSTISGLEGDTSVESLSKTQDSMGNSIPMMAVEGGQAASLQYLLSLEEYYTPESILDDVTSEGRTLLSTAIQLGHTELINIILDYVCQKGDAQRVRKYLAKADCRGRTAAHYLFNAPQQLSRLNGMVPWTQKDRIGQTPLVALCRSYDHSDYGDMVSEALGMATTAQGDGLPLRVADHTDKKGNTLLHIINDPTIVSRILHQCDVDPNATNDKRFTPLMLASKYGRVDMVRVFYGDPRVDLNLKEFRGLTAVELAKDEEVRNRIDDLTLFSELPPMGRGEARGRVTAIVRSFFVEDGTLRFILKSGAPTTNVNANGTTFTITSSRRTLADFENLACWLAMEHPASYLPNISSTRNPFQITSKPSRAVLHDLQLHLDRFLKSLLGHPTFGTHESLWEFFLVPDMQSEQIAARAKLKAELLKETIQDEYEPVSDTQDVERNIAHSQQVIQGLASRTRLLLRRGHFLQQAHNDLADALGISASALSSLGPPANVLPVPYTAALKIHSSLVPTPIDSSPLRAFIEAVTSVNSTMVALQRSFARPSRLISEVRSSSRSVGRHRSKLAGQSLPRKFNFPGMEESRHRAILETESEISQGEREVERLSRDLRWTSEVVVGELAGWTAWREQLVRDAVRRLVRDTVVKEKERGRGLERCLQALREAKDKPSPNLAST